MNPSETTWLDQGLRAADTLISQQDKIWSRYSNDKVDIGQVLTDVVRGLWAALPAERALRGLSIGSGYEPQFRLLQAACPGRLYLMDLESQALDLLAERLQRQAIDNVSLIHGDYGLFKDPDATGRFVAERLDAAPVELVLLHHSLYYSPMSEWPVILGNLLDKVLAPVGALHAVLMASRSEDETSTTWLYNHFAGRFCGHNNDQDLIVLKKQLERQAGDEGLQLTTKTSRVQFFVDDFERFMAVVWMILLYPAVHAYDEAQRREIVAFIYKNFFLPRRPMLQYQDHLVISRGVEVGRPL